MTYFGVLVRFLVPPIIVIFYLIISNRRRGKSLPESLQAWSATKAILLHILIALVYTTPWDNYLVATRVWWYDPNLVTGYTIGWVPIEEYTFFILQSLLTGLWTIYLALNIETRKINESHETRKKSFLARVLLTGFLLMLWFASAIILITGWEAGNYLALILIWAIPPIMLQTFYAADILWSYRRLIFLTISTSTIYLGFVDAAAIQSGTWFINPQKTLNISIAGILPIEEFTFFLVTNILIVFGISLFLAKQSQDRLQQLFNMWKTQRSIRNTN